MEDELAQGGIGFGRTDIEPVDEAGSDLGTELLAQVNGERLDYIESPKRSATSESDMHQAAVRRGTGQDSAADYAQNSTVTTDQAGHQRATVTDGAGRLALVGEYPGSGSYSTSYSYDALDNLTGVSQSGETRTFVYDSLKRLIAATNPETFSSGNAAALGCSSGNAPYANCYYYDANRNLTKKTDNRGLGVAYSYDALNRVQSKSYFNVPGTTNYVAANYTYDQASVSYSKGRLTSTTTTTGETSATNYLGYDALGRVLASSQTTNGNTYQFGYNYNLADALTSETYPSGRIVNTCMDGANRAFQVSVSQCGDASFAYASNVKYAVHGAPTQIVMGNNLWHNPVYNSRLQMSSFQDLLNNNVNVTLWSGNLNWGSSNNNGNLAGVTYYAGGPGYPQLLTFNQAFTYDGLNRLVSASETGGWSRTFAYDAYGNMTPSGTPAPPTVSFNSNNQIVGQQYDQAGNLLAANGNTLGYDYEGRIISEKDGQTQAVETYVFDADGRRVEKYGPSGTARIVYAYDAMGRMAAEYSTVAEAPSCVTCYLSADHLGTTRLITDQNGLVVARHDFMPFGEEVLGNTYGRDSHWGLGNDSISQKFTGKERDSESGLDFFEARYYGSALGRFTSPDPLPGWAKDPQSWNMYAYGRNNPIKYTDPDGETYRVCDSNGQNCNDLSDADFESEQKSTQSNGEHFNNGSLYHYDSNGGRVNDGTYNQTDVDVDPAVALAFHAAGVQSSAQLNAFMRDAAIVAAGGLVFPAAAAALTELAPAAEGLPMLRQVAKVLSNNSLKHIAKHLEEFQTLDQSLTMDKIIAIGNDVAQTGSQVAGNAFTKTVQIGGQEVTVRAVLNSNNALRSVHILQ